MSTPAKLLPNSNGNITVLVGIRRAEDKNKVGCHHATFHERQRRFFLGISIQMITSVLHHIDLIWRDIEPFLRD